MMMWNRSLPGSCWAGAGSGVDPEQMCWLQEWPPEEGQFPAVHFRCCKTAHITDKRACWREIEILLEVFLGVYSLGLSFVTDLFSGTVLEGIRRKMIFFSPAVFAKITRGECLLQEIALVRTCLFKETKKSSSKNFWAASILSTV